MWNNEKLTQLRSDYDVKCFCSSELDIFGIVLFSVLTFMATVSIVIFIEECIYIYKKVPPNKKTLIIWVTGASPVSIVIFLSSLFVYIHCIYTFYTWIIHLSYLSVYQRTWVFPGSWFPVFKVNKKKYL